MAFLSEWEFFFVAKSREKSQLDFIVVPPLQGKWDFNLSELEESTLKFMQH